MIHVCRNSALSKDIKLASIRHIAKTAFNSMGISGDVSLVFSDNQTIQKLNKQYRNIDEATDVLSFPSDEIDPMTNTRYLGDIIISTEKALSQSQQSGNPFFDEVCMLIVHGCLHLSGMDHSNLEEKKMMMTVQESILKSLGVKNTTWPEVD